MIIGDDEASQLLYCVGEVIRARRRTGAPVSDWLQRLMRRLELEVTVSRSRQQSECDSSDSNRERLIGSREAASILGWTTRQVQRRASDLDGRKIAGRLAFSEHAVRQYERALDDDRPAA